MPFILTSKEMLILIAKLSAFCYNFSFCLAVLTLTAIFKKIKLVCATRHLSHLLKIPFIKECDFFPHLLVTSPPENLAHGREKLMKPLKKLPFIFSRSKISTSTQIPTTFFSLFRELDAQTENETETRVQ